MQDKVKFVFVGLGAVIVIMFFFLLQSGQKAGKLKIERDDLKEAGNVLTAQLSSLTKENKQIKEEFNITKKSLEKVTAEKNETEISFKSLVEERDKLKAGVEQLNAKLVSFESNATKAGEGQKEFEAASSPTGDAYWAKILKKKVELELKLETLRGEMKTAKLENEQLKRERDELELDVQTYETENKDSDREYEYNKKLADNLTTELTREKTDKFQLADAVKSLKNENKFLKSQLKMINDRKTKLENKFAELQNKNTLLESSLVKMESFVREKILQVDSLRNDLGIMLPEENQVKTFGQNSEVFSTGKKSSIDLAPIVVKPGEEDFLDAPQSGKTVSVIAINKDNNFAIINIGSGSGVKVGDTFQIFRKGEPVGIVEVIQSRDNISACDIKKESVPIAVGDTAK